MRKYLHIILLAVVVSACGPRIIPRDKMVDIYYDMFMADQQVRENRDLQHQADTMLVYEAVFNRYGYDTDDYLNSLQYYLKDPERFSQVLQAVVERLQKDAESLNPIIAHLDWVNKYTAVEEGPSLDSIMKRYSVDTLDGKVRFYMDSSWFSSRYRMVSEPADTAKKAPADSLQAPADSLQAPADTLSKQDPFLEKEPLKPLPLPRRTDVQTEEVEVEEDVIEMDAIPE